MSTNFELFWKKSPAHDNQWGFEVHCAQCGWRVFSPEWHDYTGYDMRDHLKACGQRHTDEH